MPGNSRFAKQPSEENKKPIQITKAKIKKQSFMEKLKDALDADRVAPDDIGIWMIKDVLIPAFQKTIYDMFTGGLGMILHQRKPTPYNPDRVYGTTTSYSQYYNDRGRLAERSERRDRVRRIDEIIIPTRDQAEMVLDQMYETLKRYDRVSINDMLEMVGIRGEYTDCRYGWRDLHGSHVESVPEGYILILPTPRYLD